MGVSVEGESPLATVECDHVGPRGARPPHDRRWRRTRSSPRARPAHPPRRPSNVLVEAQRLRPPRRLRIREGGRRARSTTQAAAAGGKVTPFRSQHLPMARPSVRSSVHRARRQYRQGRPPRGHLLVSASRSDGWSRASAASARSAGPTNTSSRRRARARAGHPPPHQAEQPRANMILRISLKPFRRRSHMPVFRRASPSRSPAPVPARNESSFRQTDCCPLFCFCVEQTDWPFVQARVSPFSLFFEVRSG